LDPHCHAADRDRLQFMDVYSGRVAPIVVRASNRVSTAYIAFRVSGFGSGAAASASKDCSR
jgi:hypothetical protein